MKLEYAVLRDKILGCWQGKNVGGVLGAPFEGERGLHDLTFYSQKDLETNVPANDDLDLQIAWLNAVEEYGPCVNSSILGDYWLTYITPNWSEYGIGKSNMRRGIAPPLSGQVGNYYKDSCGCFIRSELWACLAPGLPDIATRYACIDGCVDHANEGLNGEIFFAAAESAAFVESDIRALIEIGLSYIPKDSLVAKGIRLVMREFDAGSTYIETRAKLFQEVPGAFSATWLKKGKHNLKEMAYAPIGMDAPNNVSIAVMALLYGGGDLGRTVCTAANCGEDTDCTSASAGALLGIIKGEKGLDPKWLKPINGVIKTVCLERSSGLNIPNNVTEFTDRILKCIPKFLPVKSLQMDGTGAFSVESAKSLECDRDEWLDNARRNCGTRTFSAVEFTEMGNNVQSFTFDNFRAAVYLERDPFIGEGETFTLKVRVSDSGLVKKQQWVNGDVYVSAGLVVESGEHFSVPMHNAHNHFGEATITLRAEYIVAPEMNVLIDLSLHGRHTFGVCKIKLLAK